MAEEEDFSKIPLEDRLVHKSWKARNSAYEECTKLFGQIDDPKSDEFSKYVNYLKKMVTDSNANALDKALGAVLVFAENAECVKGAAGEIMSGLVTKAFSARDKTKLKAFDICLMLIEIERGDAVVEEILKGMTAKQPKVVTACIDLMTIALASFGSKVFTLKPVVQKIPVIFSHADKNVREAASSLVIELYKWLGSVISKSLDELKPVVQKELNARFESLPNKKPAPLRYLRSEQPKQEPLVAEGREDAEQEEEEEEKDDEEEIESFVDPVNVLSSVTDAFFDDVVATKWQTRKEALEQLHKVCNVPKIVPGDFGDILRALKKVISKDSNVVVVTMAINCVDAIARGLRKDFSSYADIFTCPLLLKFKEKKVSVISSLKRALEALYDSKGNVTPFLDDILECLNDKNPSVKAETLAWFSQCLARSGAKCVPKAKLGAVGETLVKKMEDSAPNVRENAFEAFGVFMKTTGEKPVIGYLEKVDKTKEARVRASFDAAVVKGVKQSKPKKTALSSSTASLGKETKTQAASAANLVPLKRAATSMAIGGPKKVPLLKKQAPKSTSKAPTAQPENQTLKMTDEEIDEAFKEDVPESVLNGLCGETWKERLAGYEALFNHIKTKDSPRSELYVRYMRKSSKNWKENNFQIAKKMVEVICWLASEAVDFNKAVASCAIPFFCEKIGDIKLNKDSREALFCFSENVTLKFVVKQLVSTASESKNPKVISECCNWMASAIDDFGMKADPKEVVNFVIFGINQPSPVARKSAISLAVTLHVHLGPSTRSFFEDLKPQLLSTLDGEIAKYGGREIPEATRKDNAKKKKIASIAAKGADIVEDDDGDEDGNVTSIDDLIPRVDLGNECPSQLIQELQDSNWKVRSEAMEQLNEFVCGPSCKKKIGPNLGELVAVLKARTGDSNMHIQASSLNMLGTLASAMGPPISKHLFSFGTKLLNSLGHSKAVVRTAGLSALDAWDTHVPLSQWITGDYIGKALLEGNSTLRKELLTWLEPKFVADMKPVKSDYVALISALYLCLEDRSADTRKAAVKVLPRIVEICSYSVCASKCEDLKTGSKNNILAMLEKHKGSVKPKPTGSSVSSLASEKGSESNSVSSAASPTIKRGRSAVGMKTSLKARVNSASLTSKSKLEPEETDPPLTLNDGKLQRIEKDRKSLKWNFDTPREEFIVSLKDQMQHCVSKSMFEMLFHKDFKHHLTALSILIDCTKGGDDGKLPMMKELTCSLDVLLKYVTIRFFDTNPSVLLKILEFLESTFFLLSSSDYRLLDYEASILLPHLVTKVGDNHESVRKLVRGLFKLLCNLYPASKTFSYIAEGLKSKNARTRTECLDELGCFIERYGLDVCQPTPAKALHQIAQHIDDRDNSVRTAALNTCLQAYFISKDDIWKLLGPISDKNKGLLEEKIKRSSKISKSVDSLATSRSSINSDRSNMTPAREKKTLVMPKKAFQTEEKKTGVKEYSLDLDQLNLPPQPTAHKNVPELQPTSDSDVFDAPVPNLPARTKTTRADTIASDNVRLSQSVDYLVTQITSSEINVSVNALKQVGEIFKDNEKSESMKGHVDQLLIAITLQLRLVFTRHFDEVSNMPTAEASSPSTTPQKREQNVVRLCKHLLNSLMHLFCKQQLALVVSKDALNQLMTELIHRLLDDKLPDVHDGKQISRALNMLMLKVLENCHRNVTFSVLIETLQKTSVGISKSENNGKFAELAMKCLWKLTKSLDADIEFIDVDVLLLDIHGFLVTHPPAVWKNRANDMPLRTIKTLIHSLVKLKGEHILKHLSAVNIQTSNDLDNCAVVLYIKQFLKVLEKENDPKGPSTGIEDIQIEEPGTPFRPTAQKGNDSFEANSPMVLSPKEGQSETAIALNQNLSEIFVKIGSKGQTHEGLRDLYDFQLQHPEVDIKPYMSKTSEFFQGYIKRGLAQIVQERMKAKDEGEALSSSKEDSSKNPPESNTSASGDISVSYMERLRKLQSRYGLKPEQNQNPQAPPSVEKSKVSPKFTSQDELLNIQPLKQQTSNPSAKPDDSSSAAASMSILKDRLAKIKKASQNC
eukprot:Nk52_evm1s2514 gene=Nk52_evmTU1s2514